MISLFLALSTKTDGMESKKSQKIGQFRRHVPKNIGLPYIGSSNNYRVRNQILTEFGSGFQHLFLPETDTPRETRNHVRELLVRPKFPLRIWFVVWTFSERFEPDRNPRKSRRFLDFHPIKVHESIIGTSISTKHTLSEHPRMKPFEKTRVNKNRKE